jgi:hypothetical protein
VCDLKNLCAKNFSLYCVRGWIYGILTDSTCVSTYMYVYVWSVRDVSMHACASLSVDACCVCAVPVMIPWLVSEELH